MVAPGHGYRQRGNPRCWALPRAVQAAGPVGREGKTRKSDIKHILLQRLALQNAFSRVKMLQQWCGAAQLPPRHPLKAVPNSACGAAVSRGCRCFPAPGPTPCCLSWENQLGLTPTEDLPTPPSQQPPSWMHSASSCIYHDIWALLCRFTSQWQVLF